MTTRISPGGETEFFEDDDFTDTFTYWHGSTTLRNRVTPSYHYHECFEVLMVLEGSGVFYLNGAEYPLEPGTVCLVHSNDIHNAIRQNTDYYERAFVHVTESFLIEHSTPSTRLTDCFKDHRGRPQSRVIRCNPNDLRAYVADLDDTQRSQYGGDLLHTLSLLKLMVAMNRLTRDSQRDNREASAVDQRSITLPPLVSDTMAYISTHLDSDLSLTTLARHASVSAPYLSREFRRHTGMKLHDYITTKRLLRSKDLLRLKGSSQQVYRQCGFSSYSQYLRCFKQEFGMSPRDYLSANAPADNL